MPYLFKDTDIAARRLQALAEVFAPGSRDFMQTAVDTVPQLALDLGCGPGYTTRLLAEMTHATRTTGLDASEHFVALAHANATEHISFICHDITQIPFPTEPSNLIFCRMLLTHLKNPQAVIERWATQLRPQGRLLLEEVEGIRTEHSLFRTYLSIVDAMLGQQANQLYVGPFLDQQKVGGGLQRLMSRVYHLPVSTKQAATLFSLNIRTWKDNPFIREHYAASKIEQIERDLRELADHATGEGEIEWGMRQIVYERG